MERESMLHIIISRNHRRVLQLSTKGEILSSPSPLSGSEKQIVIPNWSQLDEEGNCISTLKEDKLDCK